MFSLTRDAKRSGSFATPGRPVLLVNPVDPAHLVQVEKASRGEAPGLSIRASFDGGLHWRESWPLPGARCLAALESPALAVDAQNTLHLVALARPSGRDQELTAYRSQDGGLHWSDPVVVLESAGKCRHSIAAGAYVYLATDAHGWLYLARSSDGEQFMAPPGGPVWPGACFAPEVFADSAGGVRVVWITGRNGRAILISHSNDQGDSFTHPVPIADGISTFCDEFVDSVPATCFDEGGAAVCAWADERESQSRIYFRRSADGGRTWQGPPSGAPLLRSTQPRQQEFQPRLTLTPAGEVCCTYWEFGPKAAGGRPYLELVMAVSNDHGESFGSRMVLSEHPWDPIAGGHAVSGMASGGRS